MFFSSRLVLNLFHFLGYLNESIMFNFGFVPSVMICLDLLSYF